MDSLTNVDFWDSKSMAAIIGGMIAILSALLSLIVNNRFQLKRDKIDYGNKSRDKIKDDIKNSIGLLSTYVLMAQHSMEWILWFGSKGRIDGNLIENYHKEVHEAFPKVLSQLTMIASIDIDLYKVLFSIIDKEIFELELRIANKLINYEQDKEDLLEFQELHKEAAGLYVSLPKKIGNILNKKLQSLG